MPKPAEYKHIKAWGYHMYSYAFYVDNQQEEAAADNAPINAIYKKHGTDEWRTSDDIVDAPLRDKINKRAEQL